MMTPVKNEYKFLYWLRYIGVCMIVYDHLGALRNPNWLITEIVNNLINAPLGIIQYFGAFGVCLFFIISGFLLSSNTANGRNFLQKKFTKVLITTLAYSIIFFVFNKIISIVFWPTYWAQFSNKNWFEGATLLCYVLGKENSINGALWYLFPLLFSELIFGLFYKFIQKNILYFPAIIDSLFIILIICVKYNSNLRFVRMQWLIFSLLPVFGLLIRAVYDKKISIKKFIVFFIINYLVFLNGIIVFHSSYYTEQPYLISLAYALLIFCLFLLMEEKFILPKHVRFISNISFSIYLTHMTFGSFLMSLFEMKIDFTLSFAITVCFIVLLSWIQHIWVEKKISNLWR